MNIYKLKLEKYINQNNIYKINKYKNKINKINKINRINITGGTLDDHYWVLTLVNKDQDINIIYRLKLSLNNNHNISISKKPIIYFKKNKNLNIFEQNENLDSSVTFLKVIFKILFNHDNYNSYNSKNVNLLYYYEKYNDVIYNKLIDYVISLINQDDGYLKNYITSFKNYKQYTFDNNYSNEEKKQNVLLSNQNYSFSKLKDDTKIKDINKINFPVLAINCNRIKEYLEEYLNEYNLLTNYLKNLKDLNNFLDQNPDQITDQITDELKKKKFIEFNNYIYKNNIYYNKINITEDYFIKNYENLILIYNEILLKNLTISDLTDNDVMSEDNLSKLKQKYLLLFSNFKSEYLIEIFNFDFDQFKYNFNIIIEWSQLIYDSDLKDLKFKFYFFNNEKIKSDMYEYSLKLSLYLIKDLKDLKDLKDDFLYLELK